MRSFLILLTLSATLHADVLKVSADGAGTFASIQLALAVAEDGDIILVDPNVSVTPSAAPVTIDKSLTIIGDGAGRGLMPVTTVEVGADAQVVLRNLRFVPSPFQALDNGSLWIRSSAGSVLVEDCEMRGWSDILFAPADGGVGMRVTDSSAVSIARCTIEGGFGTSTFNTPPITVGLAYDGGIGLSTMNARVAVYDSELTGGYGGWDTIFGGPAGDGALGLRAQDSELWLTGCTVTGGVRGLGTPNGLPAAGAELIGATQHTRRLDTSFVGGGLAAPLVANGTPITSWAGAAISFELSAPVRPEEAASVVVSGPTGTFFGLFASFGPGFFPKDAFHGVVATELTTFTGPLFVANIPAGGVYELDFSVPTTGVDGFLNVDQVFSDQGPDGIVLSGASAWVQIEGGL